MLRFAAQPADKGALEELGVEPICLRTPVLARHRDARWMDHIRFDSLSAQPARQPESVAAGLVGDGDPVDRMAGFRGFFAPTVQKLQEGVAVRAELLQGIAIQSWHDARDQPTRLAHLDDGDQCRVLLKRDEGFAQVVLL